MFLNSLVCMYYHCSLPNCMNQQADQQTCQPADQRSTNNVLHRSNQPIYFYRCSALEVPTKITYPVDEQQEPSFHTVVKSQLRSALAEHGRAVILTKPKMPELRQELQPLVNMPKTPTFWHSSAAGQGQPCTGGHVLLELWAAALRTDDSTTALQRSFIIHCCSVLKRLIIYFNLPSLIIWYLRYCSFQHHH